MRKIFIGMAAAAAAVALGDVVPAEVAETVARAQVEAAFPGEAWVKVDCAAAEDSEGAAGAYAFVFGVSGSGYETAEGVRSALEAGESGDDGESGLYASTATVVTGAKDTDALILRSFRGLAGWYADLVREGGTAVRTGAAEVQRAPAAPAGARGNAALGRLRAKAAEREAARAEGAAGGREELKAAEAEAAAAAAAARKARWAAAAEAARGGRSE